MLTGSNANAMIPQFAILVVFIALMYFILIRPQKKKDQEVNDMRNSLQVGDEIITIGGILGRIVKTKDDSIVIQVGADKTKFEIKKWAVSSVEKKAAQPTNRKSEDDMAEEEKKVKPKRLGKKTETMEEEAQELASEVGDSEPQAEDKDQADA